MKKIQTQLPEIILVGQQVRTNNATEIDPLKGKIFPCIKSYFSGNLASQIQHRVKPGTTYCVYANYESDHNGDYTYFVGEAVEHLHNIPEGFTTLTIQPQEYAKFTTEPGTMPDVIRSAWFEIWAMPEEVLGGKRRYHADFEVYDERASDPNHNNIVLDIYIGLK